MPGRASLGEGERVVEEAQEIGWCVGLVERAPPGDVAGVGRAQVRQEASARRRLRTVGSDEHVHLDGPVAIDVRTHHAVAVGEIRECCTPMVAVGREGGGECAIDRLPRSEVLRRALDLACAAFGAEIPTHRAVRRRQGVLAMDP